MEMSEQEEKAKVEAKADEGQQTPDQEVESPVEQQEVKAEEQRESASNEEEKSDVAADELEEEDHHDDAVDSDEEDHDHHMEGEEEESIPDYSTYSTAQLIQAAEKLLKEQPIQKLKPHFDLIRKNVLQHLNEERNAKLEQFLEEGGNQIDFEYHQAERDAFRSIYGEYRSKRKKYYDDLSAQLETNLAVKRDLIEKLKEIVTKDESIGDTFKEFNELQQQWRSTGPVPRAESGDLWRTYHHHVENFYEYIKINKELRDLDFKKNQEAKEALIAEAEALQGEDSLKEAFAKLQKLHKKWKHIGPVERELREPLWERFSAATKKMHEKREEYYAEMREKAEGRIEQKKKLLAELKSFPVEKIKNHKQWQAAIKGVEALRQAFVQIGRINHPENDALWEELRDLLRHFNHEKNSFYKAQKKQFQDNLDRKKALLDKAEALKDSEDWKTTTNELKRIQAEWKKIGHVPRAEGDKVWNAFRAACNHFFNRLTQHNKQADEAFADNYAEKKKLLESFVEMSVEGKGKEAVNEIKKVIGQWRSIGKVPRDKMDIEQQFNQEVDAKFAALKMDRQERQRIQYENKLESLGDDDYALQRERSRLLQQRDEARRNLTQLENNMGFFSSSGKGDNPLLKEAQKNIDRQRSELEQIENKLQMLAKSAKD